MSVQVPVSEFIEVIKQEIKWCNDHPAHGFGLSEDYGKGFVRGLEQAAYLLKVFQDKVNNSPGICSPTNPRYWVSDT